MNSHQCFHYSNRNEYFGAEKVFDAVMPFFVDECVPTNFKGLLMELAREVHIYVTVYAKINHMI